MPGRVTRDRRVVSFAPVAEAAGALLNEALFRSALDRERKRADRFEEPFALLLIALDDRSARGLRRAEVLRALTSTCHETDLLGWFEQGAIVGLIRPLYDVDPREAAASLAAAVRQELARCLTSESAAGCSIRLEVYRPEHGCTIPAFVEVRSRRQKTRQHVRDGAKRTLDVVGSAALLMTLGPVFLIVAALVKLTSEGPIFFRQQRIGQAGQPFSMLKFRTMYVGVDATIHEQYVAQFIEAGAAAKAKEDDGKTVFKIVDDPRVTPLGRLLRRSSLDELPQFWNVLKGEMSLVGPRPPLPYEVARYKPWHQRRVLEAKAGITGLWQVTGRSKTTFDEMVRLDLRYAKTYSLWTDIKILLATPRAVVSGKGAH
jgi:lipopolysaccharide/colanic/teichoic acid biosynthesis glycosyltransferase